MNDDAIAVLARLARHDNSGVQRANEAPEGERKFLIDFRIFDRPRLHLGLPRHGGIVRSIPGCPRLHCESGWIRSPRPGSRERLVWLVYLRPEPRDAKILEFPLSQ